MDPIEWRQVDFLRHFLAGPDIQRRVSLSGGSGRDRLTFASGHFEPEPRLAVLVMKINIAPGKVRDDDAGDNRFVGDVLEARQFQLDLNLSSRSACEQAEEAE